jgi:hypothetical protein
VTFDLDDLVTVHVGKRIVFACTSFGLVASENEGFHSGITTVVLPLFFAMVSMHPREHAVWIPSSSDLSNHAPGLNQFTPLCAALARLPQPSQMYSQAMVGYACPL